jgi:hypothetical protein
LPYGIRKAKTSKGEVLDIPSAMRLHAHEEIVRMYSKYMHEIDQEDKLLSRSSMLRILDICSAHKKRALKCVDYIASAMEEVTFL